MKKLMLGLGVAAIIVACSSGGGGGGGVPNNVGTVNGVVTDSNNSQRLSGVTVTVGSKSTTTNANGEFSLDGLPSGMVVVGLSLNNYAPGYVTTNGGDDGTAVLTSIKKQGSLQNYDPTQAQTLSESTDAGPYAVIFQPNTLDTTDTSLKVSVTPVDPTKEASVLPGELVTSDALLVPLTFADFSIFDSSNNRVNLKPGSEAIVELPIPPDLRGNSQYSLGTTVHCYSFNPATGQWEDFVVGTITISSVDGYTPVVKASVKHFSWYGAAPESTDCVDVYGQVVSAVDGKPLAGARVEAFPGGRVTTDSNGYFIIRTSTNANPYITASRTYTDTDGSITGTPGTKVIEFGKLADIPLTGLVSRPCNGSPVTNPNDTTVGGVSPTPVVVTIGDIGTVSYEVVAYLTDDGAFASIYEILPDGTEGENVTGAKITINVSDGTSFPLTDQYNIGTYWATGITIQPGARYTINVDADGNGSTDGTGSVFAVGTPTWVNPTNGATVPTNGLVAKWSDSAVGINPAYSAQYYADISSSTDFAFYWGTDRQFTVLNYINGNPLSTGDYSGTLWSFSGPFTQSSTDFTITNNINGAMVSGQFYSFGAAATISFTLN